MKELMLLKSLGTPGLGYFQVVWLGKASMNWESFPKSKTVSLFTEEVTLFSDINGTSGPVLMHAYQQIHTPLHPYTVLFVWPHTRRFPMLFFHLSANGHGFVKLNCTLSPQSAGLILIPFSIFSVNTYDIKEDVSVTIWQSFICPSHQSAIRPGTL